MSEMIKIAKERLANSRRISTSQQQTTEMLLKRSRKQLEEANDGGIL